MTRDGCACSGSPESLPAHVDRLRARQLFGALIGDEPAIVEERAAFAAAVAGQPGPAS